jgi:hypothetical protein
MRRCSFKLNYRHYKRIARERRAEAKAQRKDVRVSECVVSGGRLCVQKNKRRKKRGDGDHSGADDDNDVDTADEHRRHKTKSGVDNDDDDDDADLEGWIETERAVMQADVDKQVTPVTGTMACVMYGVPSCVMTKTRCDANTRRRQTNTTTRKRSMICYCNRLISWYGCGGTMS